MSSSEIEVGTAARRLREAKNEILVVWETRSRIRIDAASNKDSKTIQDDVAAFLDAIVKNLEFADRPNSSVENKSAEEHGRQRAELVGYTLSAVIKEYALFRSTIVQMLLTTGPLHENEREIIHKTLDHAIELAVNEFSNAEKQKLKSALEKAEESNRSLDRFAAIAAHDLRSPLGSIAGFAELLGDEMHSQSDDVKEYLKFIQNAVKRMTGLIEGVLDYARLASVEKDFKNVNCGDAVSAASENLKSELAEQQGKVTHGPLPHVMANLALLTQLFQNLFANALKFRGTAAPVIHVKAELMGEEWCFSVQDNGIGFSSADKEIIFDLHKKLNPDQQGAGIGLSTCRRVVDFHGGRMWAESEPEGGATFFFTLPRVDPLKN